MEWFSDYLHGELDPPNNGLVAADNINEQLKKSQENAKNWQSDAYLANFTYYVHPGSMDDYVFTWVSPSNPTKMYVQSNSQTIGQEKENTYKNSYGIFRVPLTMRKLTKALLADKNALPYLDKYFGSGNVDEIKFSLEKNATNKLMWTIIFTDSSSKKSHIVKVDADKIQNPVFNLLGTNYIKPIWEE